MKMTGWKTKTGAGLLALAGILTAVIPVLPPMVASSVVIAAWLKFGAAVLTASGAAFLGLGISHKIEKGPDVQPPPVTERGDGPQI